MADNLPTPLFRMEEVAHAVGGALVGGPGAAPHAVTIDSRSVPPRSLFVPLRGSRVDGHDYIDQALTGGAVSFLVSREVAGASGVKLDTLVERRGCSYVVVEDTLRALQALAAWHLGRSPGLIRIGVTGSNGKTTTKELLGSVLRGWKPTSVSPGNYNSETGLPLACFRVGSGAQAAVFEMAMNHLGEIHALADIVRPQHAIVTNIGMAHIGFCGSQEAIAREKKSIFDFFTGSETAFVPAGDRFEAYLASGVRGRVVLHGPGATRGFEKSEARGLDGSTIYWEGLRLRLPLVGRHNVLNALCAISVASVLGVPAAVVQKGIEAAGTLPGRSQIMRGRVTVIADFYNSSPESVTELLEMIHGLPRDGRRVGVFGGMLELGEATESEHRTMGARVGRAGFDAVVFFGAETRVSSEVAARLSPETPVHWTQDHQELNRLLGEVVRDGDLVAVKGSRGMELERTLPVLLPETTRAEGAPEGARACS